MEPVSRAWDTARLGAIPQTVTRALGGKQGIGIHSGAIGDGIADLMEAGIVDNRHKEIDPAVTVATMRRSVGDASGAMMTGVFTRRSGTPTQKR